MPLQDSLDEKVRLVSPIAGISFGDLNDKRTWRIDFDESATPQQKNAAKDVVDNFVYDDEEKEKDKLRQLVDKVKSDPLYRREYKLYLSTNPSATFKDFIVFLETF